MVQEMPDTVITGIMAQTHHAVDDGLLTDR
jgi:hypothetical protein